MDKPNEENQTKRSSNPEASDSLRVKYQRHRPLAPLADLCASRLSYVLHECRAHRPIDPEQLTTEQFADAFQTVRARLSEKQLAMLETERGRGANGQRVLSKWAMEKDGIPQLS